MGIMNGSNRMIQWLSKGTREVNKLFETDGLGASLGWDADLFERRKDNLNRPILFQKLGHHLATLRESEFHDSCEVRCERRIQQRWFAPQEADESRIHIRFGKETTRGNFM